MTQNLVSEITGRHESRQNNLVSEITGRHESRHNNLVVISVAIYDLRLKVQHAVSISLSAANFNSKL
jgi:hypothetical protein